MHNGKSIICSTFRLNFPAICMLRKPRQLHLASCRFKLGDRPTLSCQDHRPNHFHIHHFWKQCRLKALATSCCTRDIRIIGRYDRDKCSSKRNKWLQRGQDLWCKSSLPYRTCIKRTFKPFLVTFKTRLLKPYIWPFWSRNTKLPSECQLEIAERGILELFSARNLEQYLLSLL